MLIVHLFLLLMSQFTLLLRYITAQITVKNNQKHTSVFLQKCPHTDIKTCTNTLVKLVSVSATVSCCQAVMMVMMICCCYGNYWSRTAKRRVGSRRSTITDTPSSPHHLPKFSFSWFLWFFLRSVASLQTQTMICAAEQKHSQLVVLWSSVGHCSALI